MTPGKIGVGLYGGNGHQVTGLLSACPFGDLVACAQIEPPEGSPAARYASLAELLRVVNRAKRHAREAV